MRTSMLGLIVIVIIATLVMLMPSSVPADAQGDASPTVDPFSAASYRVEKLFDANFPIAIDWTPDGRMFLYRAFYRQLARGQHRRQPATFACVDISCGY